MSNKSSIEWLISQLQKSKDWHRVLNEISQMSSARVDIIKQAKEMHKQEIYQHAINFYLFVENDEVTDQKVEIIENLYKDYLKQFYNETFGK